MLFVRNKVGKVVYSTYLSKHGRSARRGFAEQGPLDSRSEGLSCGHGFEDSRVITGLDYAERAVMQTSGVLLYSAGGHP